MTNTPAEHFPDRFPERVDLLKSADQGFKWLGRIPVSRFTRLAESVLPECAEVAIDVRCHLEVNEKKIVWFEAEMSGTVQVTCHRCIQPVDICLDGDMRFAILTDDSFCERLNESDDFVVLAEEELVHGVAGKPGDVDLLALIEDELLLSLPLSPRHDGCSPAVSVEYQEAVEEEAEVRDNPFDMLSVLKRQ